MYRAILAAALIFTGASAASAQGYRHDGYGYGYRRPAPVFVVPHRPVFMPPHRRFGYGYHRFHRNHGWDRPWRHGRSW